MAGRGHRPDQPRYRADMPPHESDTRRRRAAELLPALARHRPALTEDERTNANELAAELLELAREHRIAGIVQRVVADQAVELPAEIAEAFIAERRRAAAHQMLAVHAIQELNEVLPIRFLVVKGPILASHWHGDAGARNYSDIDVLVSPDDLSNTIEALTSVGFRVASNNWANFHRLEVAEIPLHSSLVTVDLHWDLLGFGEHRRSLALDSRAMMDRGVAVDLPGVQVATLDPVDTLLHVCIHAGLAGGKHLLNLLDVDVVARSADIAWDQFWDRAERAAAVTLAAGVLRRSQHLFDTPIPDALGPAARGSRSWHRVATALEALPRRGGQPPIGFHLKGARDSPKRTIIATTVAAARSASVKAGNTSLTETGGALAWYQGDIDDADIVTARENYLSWVHSGGQAYSIHRTHDVERLDRMFAHLGARSESALAHMWSRDELDDRVKAYVIRRGDGELAGLLVVTARHPLYALASPILLDPGASAVLGRFIDRSRAVSMVGFQADIGPLRPHISRWHREEPVTFGSIPHDTLPDLPEASARLATGDDVRALTDLAMNVGPRGFASRLFVYRWAKRALRTGTAVVEQDGQLIGSATIEASTPRYDVVGTTSILLGARDQHVSRLLTERLATLARERGRGIIGISSSSDPTTMPSDGAIYESGTVAMLRLPRGFKDDAPVWRSLEGFAGCAADQAESASSQRAR